MSYAISMQDARLIARLRRGEREALAGLQEDWRDEIWSVCGAMTGSEGEARALVQTVWRSLRDETRVWSATTPLCCQLAGLVCRVIVERLSLPQPDAEEMPFRFAERDVEAQEVAARVRQIPPATRLIFLLDLYFGCPADALAAATGVPVGAVRYARSAAIWRMVAPGGVDARAWARELRLLPDLLADDLDPREADLVRGAVEDDPSLDALADRLFAAAETCRAVLHQPPPEAAQLAEAAPAPPPDLLGALGGVVAGLLCTLACLIFLLPLEPPPLAGPLAAHLSAVGRAPGYLAEADAGALARGLVAAGVPPATARVDDWSRLRLRLKGGIAAPGGALGAVMVYGLDGRTVTVEELPAPPLAGAPLESWEVAGVRLAAWEEGGVGLVVMTERAVGRSRVFASSMPVGQLLALLAWGLSAEG